MPYESKAQQAWAHTPAGEKALGGPEKVHEWDEATKDKPGGFSSLPSHVKGYAGGGVVTADFAKGGPVLGRTTNFVKGEEMRAIDFKKRPNKDFLGTPDRFTGHKNTVQGAPKSQQSDEDWEKPASRGQSEKDDKGDSKSLKPVLPRR